MKQERVGKISTEHITIFLRKDISKVAIEVKFHHMLVTTQVTNTYRETKQISSDDVQ